MKDILKYSIWIGIYTVLIVPFIVANGMFFPYIVGKAFTFRIIVEIISALWLILILKDKEARPKCSWISWSVVIFTFILLLADIWAVAPFKAFWGNYERMEGWVTFAHLLGYFFVLSSMLKTEKLWLWFLRANIGAGVILAIMSIDNATQTRFSGPLGNPIYISVYFLFIFFFTLILLYKDVLARHLIDWTSFKKVFTNTLFYVYLFVSALSLFVVYRTSRGALLGLIGGVLVSALLIAIFEKQNRVIKQISLGILTITVVAIFAFIGSRDTQFIKNNPTLSRLAEVSWSNINGQARQLVWPMAIKGFQEKPILGWGQDGFNYVFNKYYDPRMYGQEQWFDRAHNAPLDFLVAGGILGLLSYLALFGSTLYLLWFRKNSISITEQSLLTGLLVGYFFQALFVFDNLVSYIMFFTTLAYIHSRLVEHHVRKDSQGYLSAFINNKEQQNYILIPAIVILASLAVWWVNVPAIKANKDLIQAFRLIQAGKTGDGLNSFKSALAQKSLGDSEIREQLLSYTPAILESPQIDNNIKQEFVTLTIEEVNKQIERVPNDARYYILTGAFLNNLGNYQEALAYVEKAVEFSPQKQSMRFELVRSLYGLGRKEEALAEAKKAYELDVNYDQAKSIYEQVQALIKK